MPTDTFTFQTTLGSTATGTIVGIRGDYARVQIQYPVIAYENLVSLTDGSLKGKYKGKVWLDATELAALRERAEYGISFIVYGNFTDPVMGVNFITVQGPYTVPFRKLCGLAKALTQPWCDEDKRKHHIYVDHGDRMQSASHYKYDNGSLIKIHP